MLHAVNDGVAEVASGIPTRPLFGRAWFEEEISGLRLRVSAGSFLQTNTEMADVLYRDAIEQAGLTGGEIVWDLYCGTGSIGLALAGSARRVIGVEIVAEAIERARENALANGVANIQFLCADAGKAPRDLIAEGLPAPDVIVLDPPRAGMTPKAARRVAELGAKRIVYVSCNPTTLAGNAPILAEGGYALTRLRPFDLFPHTPHVECVAVFERDPASARRSLIGVSPRSCTRAAGVCAHGSRLHVTRSGDWPRARAAGPSQRLSTAAAPRTTRRARGTRPRRRAWPRHRRARARATG